MAFLQKPAPKDQQLIESSNHLWPIEQCWSCGPIAVLRHSTESKIVSGLYTFWAFEKYDNKDRLSFICTKEYNADTDAEHFANVLALAYYAGKTTGITLGVDIAIGGLKVTKEVKA